MALFDRPYITLSVCVNNVSTLDRSEITLPLLHPACDLLYLKSYTISRILSISYENLQISRDLEFHYAIQFASQLASWIA